MSPSSRVMATSRMKVIKYWQLQIVINVGAQAVACSKCSHCAQTELLTSRGGLSNETLLWQSCPVLHRVFFIQIIMRYFRNISPLMIILLIQKISPAVTVHSEVIFRDTCFQPTYIRFLLIIPKPICWDFSQKSKTWLTLATSTAFSYLDGGGFVLIDHLLLDTFSKTIYL